MKRIFTVFGIILLCGNTVFSQQLKEFEITKFDGDVPINICGNTMYGVLVFYSAIRDLQFEISNVPGALVNQTYNNGLKAHILCVLPTEEGRKYRISIKQREYITREESGIEVKANERLYWKINPKQNTVVAKVRKPLIEDWTKDFKIIAGLSNGIVAGEIIGVYGEVKFGKRTGFALEGGYGVGIGENDSERWSVGVKGLYKNFFLSTHYGTTLNITKQNDTFTMNDDGTFILSGSRSIGRKGVTLLSGYDRTFRWFHLTTGIGGIVTTTAKPKFLFAWNVGIGVSFMDLFNR